MPRKRPPDDKQRVELRRNLGPKRRKQVDLLHHADELTSHESFRSKDAQKKRVVDTTLTASSTAQDTAGAASKSDPAGSAAAGRPESLAGVVTRVFSQWMEVHDGQRLWLCSLRRLLKTVRLADRNPVVVGDRVLFSAADEPLSAAGLDAGQAESLADLPRGVIDRVLARQGELCRRSKGKWHSLVANVDLLLIVVAVDHPPPSTQLIDRYLVAASAGEVAAAIALNKVDLDPAAAAVQIDRLREIYTGLGIGICPVSAQSGEGIAALRERLLGRCAALAGQSGVGKSSLINACFPHAGLRTGEISAWWSRGKHTTTTAQLIPVDAAGQDPGGASYGGSYIVDTPGVRQFGLMELAARELAPHLPDFARFLGQCRFNDCSHQHEDGCAIRAAVERGEIHPSRFRSFEQMVAGKLDC